MPEIARIDLRLFQFWQSPILAILVISLLPLAIASRLESRYSPPMPKDFICLVCEQPEKKCQCDRYCWLCQSLYEVRLCEDGQYYCQPCREACDMEAQYRTRE